MSSSWWSRDVHSVLGARVRGPEEAMAVLRKVVRRVSAPQTVAMLLDCRQCVVTLATIGARRTPDRVAACSREDAAAVVVATFRAGGPTLPTDAELISWNNASAQLEATGLVLLDWLFVSDHRWRSIRCEA